MFQTNQSSSKVDLKQFQYEGPGSRTGTTMTTVQPSPPKPHSSSEVSHPPKPPNTERKPTKGWDELLMFQARREAEYEEVPMHEEYGKFYLSHILLNPIIK